MTAQITEIVFIGDEGHQMTFCPPIPKGHDRIVLRDPGKMDEYDEILCSTACWRGYQGIWWINDDRFYLARIEGKYEMLGKEPILADWFTGVLRIPRGKLLQYVHMGYGSVFEEELHIEVENGLVVRTTVLDNRERQHDRDKLTWENLPGNENRFPGDGKDGSVWNSILRFFRKQ